MWEVSGAIDDGKRFEYRKHNAVAIRFGNVIAHKLNGFNHQNVIDDCEVQSFKNEAGNICFDVYLPALFGADLKSKYRQIEVLSLTPGVPAYSVYDSKLVG